MQVAHGGSSNVAKITRKTARLKKRVNNSEVKSWARLSNSTEALVDYLSRDGRSTAVSLRFPVYLVVVDASSTSSRLELSESHEAELYFSITNCSDAISWRCQRSLIGVSVSAKSMMGVVPFWEQPEA